MKAMLLACVSGIAFLFPAHVTSKREGVSLKQETAKDLVCSLSVGSTALLSILSGK
jgi:hypothetical protein